MSSHLIRIPLRTMAPFALAGALFIVPSAARGGQRGFGAAGQPPAAGQRKADSPVSAWPMTRVCISTVPS